MVYPTKYLKIKLILRFTLRPMVAGWEWVLLYNTICISIKLLCTWLNKWGISTNLQLSYKGLKRTEGVLDQPDTTNITSQAIVHQDQNVQLLLLYKLAQRLRLEGQIKTNTFGCPRARLWPCHQPRQRTLDTTTTHQDNRTPLPSQQDTLTQCWFIVRSSSATLPQQWTHIESVLGNCVLFVNIKKGILKHDDEVHIIL